MPERVRLSWLIALIASGVFSSEVVWRVAVTLTSWICSAAPAAPAAAGAASPGASAACAGSAYKQQAPATAILIKVLCVVKSNICPISTYRIFNC